ncbi:MAG: hypothetical protein IJ581_05655 [Paludibacteraceae bacterium]|nr:hypothetical protein [Paludibacteraceae bacterium]
MSLPSAHRTLLVSLLLTLSPLLMAFTPTGVAPAFFGPNALPVPDMSDGRTSEDLRIELAGDGYFGYDGSRTADLFARVQVPLFTRWANLSVWMPVYEWFRQSDGTGNGAGDVYLSTDIQVLHHSWFAPEQQRRIPQMTIRLGMKTASGGQYARRRHFDDPGYFFDMSIGNSLYLNDWEMRLAGSVGFLCWQTADARQNDAVMYGLQLTVRHTYASLQATWGGYVGWERYGDAPMTLKLRAAGHIRRFEPFLQYQYGIQDYPFHQLRLGLVYNLDILTRPDRR